MKKLAFLVSCILALTALTGCTITVSKQEQTTTVSDVASAEATLGTFNVSL